MLYMLPLIFYSSKIERLSSDLIIFFFLNHINISIALVVILAEHKLLKLSISFVRFLIHPLSCSTILLRYFDLPYLYFFVKLFVYGFENRDITNAFSIVTISGWPLCLKALTKASFSNFFHLLYVFPESKLYAITQ